MNSISIPVRQSSESVEKERRFARNAIGVIKVQSIGVKAVKSIYVNFDLKSYSLLV